MTNQKGFTLRKNGGVSFLTIPSFERAGGVVCAFSTRIGGVSPAPFDTLNFSRKREQNPQNFSENLHRFAIAVGFDAHKAVCINYAHSTALHRAVSGDAGRGLTRPALSDVCDGLYTNAAGLPLISFHADCVPLFFYDPARKNVAVCHAGWRGVAGHMGRRAVDALQSLGSRPTDILAAIGPCISVRNYEVGEDVATVFEREFSADVTKRHGGRAHIDLVRACAEDIAGGGVPRANITDARLCTYENPQLFYSHRRDKGQTGAMAAVIMLKDDEHERKGADR